MTVSRAAGGRDDTLRGGALRAQVASGGLASFTLDDGDLHLVQHAASAFEPGLWQVWVRDRAGGRAWPVLGAGSGGSARVGQDRFQVDGAEPGGGLRWRATFVLHPARAAWALHLLVVNDGAGARQVDVVHTHDVALSQAGALRANELYVSQYLDLSTLDGPTGPALAVRQNQPQGGRHPWCVLAADRRVVGWATDALQVHGLAGRGGGPVAPVGDLPSRRLQHEHTLAALQVEPATLAPGEQLGVTFAGLVLADHPAATSTADASLAAEALDLAAGLVTGLVTGALADDGPAAGRADGPEPTPVPHAASPAEPAAGYGRGREARVRDLDDGELRARWPGRWRLVERGPDGGELHSFFSGDEHVVLRAKELAVLRPHGTILRTGDRAVPDPESLTVTAWMTGSPLSYLTRGHATTGRVLTTVRGYLGLHRAYGLRVFVEAGGVWRLLDLPSAFATALDAAHWVYALAPDGPDEPGGVVELRTTVPASEHRVELQVAVAGAPRRVLLALHLAGPDDPLPPAAPVVEASAGGVEVRVASPSGPQVLAVTSSVPVTVGDGSLLVDDAAQDAVVTLGTGPVTALALGLTVRDGAVGDAAAPAASETAVLDHAAEPAARDGWWADVAPWRLTGPESEVLDASLPWLVRDALVHHLSPRGLEQYTGGAWGTRDVTQGPLELLLALDRLDDARTLVLQVLGAQNRDGSWPQAFGFLPGDEGFRHEPPHGDVVHWPVLALGRYLLAAADGDVLDAAVGWFGHDGTSTVLDHALRALDHARAGVLPGTRLVAYGHGDWNDSLQPADPTMAATMTSTWTVILHRQALRTLADGIEAARGDAELVAALRAEAEEVAADLRRYLLVDGELAGYAQLEPAAGGEPRVVRYLVHPRDEETGLHRGALQTIHALVDDLLEPPEAAHHAALVREHLMGVDGVRLFDRPPAYHGGQMRHFQRAETATFVGREIGLMYVHAHLRWCEAMARLGDAEALWLGVHQVLPAAVGALPGLVPGARPRQASTYASSSDAVVADRAEFAARYDDVLSGGAGLEAGWRIYSSGPGVLVRVVSQSLLGVRRRGDRVELDPVLPPRLDGVTAVVPLAGGRLRVRYRVGDRGCGVAAVRLGGEAGWALDAQPLENPYRPAGVAVPLAALEPALDPDGPELVVELG